MGCPAPDSDSIDPRIFSRDSAGPIVLLAIRNEEVLRRFAYQLTASGFGVVLNDDDAVRHHAPRPDVVVADFDPGEPDGGTSLGNISNDRQLRGVPIIAIAADASDATRTRARAEGCAAVCLATCSTTALAAGIRAVLGQSGPFTA